MNSFINKDKKADTTYTKRFKSVMIMFLALFMSISFAACGPKEPASDYVENEADQSYDMNREALDVEQLGKTILEETEDAGQEYLDNTLFIGDSNTVRSMVYGHTTWDNVVAAVSMGVQHIKTLEMTYFKGYAKPVTVPKAVEIIQPQRIIITYGSNNVFMDTDEFIKQYISGLEAIKEAYPYADIIINSIPPIDRERENLKITMQAIDKLNKALSEMAKEEGYKFLNSSEVLKDEKTGFAKKDYTIGDGVHLSKTGMDELFKYIRTHAYITKDTRPKPLKKVPAREETPTGIITEDPLAVRGTRIKLVFVSSDTALGSVTGEVEQKIKRTITSKEVTAVPNLENGGIFTGWSCSVGKINNRDSETITYTVPKVEDSVTEIAITANFAKTSVEIKKDGKKTDKFELEVGKSVKLSADITGGFKGNRDVVWSVADGTVASVFADGSVIAISEGKTTVTASILGGKIKASCEITVKPAEKAISIEGETNVEAGKTTRLKLNFLLPGVNADGPAPTWLSSDESVATVSSSGVVTGIKKGTAVITVKFRTYTESVTITVTEAVIPEETTEPEPTIEPTAEPTAKPTTSPTAEPTVEPTEKPQETVNPTTQPAETQAPEINSTEPPAVTQRPTEAPPVQTQAPVETQRPEANEGVTSDNPVE